ncbi:phytanoyl-CoA dioxygenase family protein [Paenibacillus piri]|uniref:Phytanoyl-CoA dioxygenase n=1 Tax=Paenibacillus piri TaxID=2547395 RepID=A0A4R5KKZ6_9BACL|nr:phytanoyl-CoA dioxygenase family protein [Paenibacillus piri]TDF95110.1 hypothetical protein E1757_21485 [Paenibacillus piri]
MRLSQEELASGQLLPETLELAANLVRVNGFVTFEEIIPRAVIDKLYDAYIDILEPYLAEHHEEVYNPKNGFNDGTNHIRLYLPFEKPFVDEQILAHPFVLSVVDQVLGDDCAIRYFATNTSLPGGRNAQPVHSDMHSMFGLRYGANLPISNLIVNVPLVDTTENNGPMEYWPGGTHLQPDYMYDRKSFPKAKLAEHMTVLKATMPAGSIMIRDDRMWHRGTPNKSDKPRPNIAVIYSAPTTNPSKGTIPIPQETFDGLSPRLQKLLRFEKIGHPALKPTHYEVKP